MKVLSLFDGISCAKVALKKAGIEVEEYYASEIDKYAISISERNHPDIIRVGDVRFVTGIMGIDLLIGGSPCQDLSIAKRDRKGLDGDKSGLFWEYIRILNETKPKHFILENVASMSKESKNQISEVIGFEPVMINAALVSAQQRKRLFWVGKYNSTTKKYLTVQITQPEDRKIMLKDILIDGIETKEKSLCITATYSRACPQDYLGKSSRKLIKVGEFNSVGQADSVYSIEGKSVTLSANSGGRGAKTGLYLVQGVARRTRNGEKQTEANGKEKANAITTVQTDSMVGNTDVYRKLHPVECERLQGLPDNYTEGVSNSQRYKMLGNGFNCDIIAHILKYLHD